MSADPRPVVEPAAIPIHVRDDGAHVHHLATPEDLVAVMRRLPPGVVDGVAAIVLSLGRAAQAPDDDDEDVGDERAPDPFSTGRLGHEPFARGPRRPRPRPVPAPTAPRSTCTPTSTDRTSPTTGSSG